MMTWAILALVGVGLFAFMIRRAALHRSAPTSMTMKEWQHALEALAPPSTDDE